MEMKIEKAEEGIVNVEMSGSFGFQDHMGFNDFMTEIKDQKKTVNFDLRHLEMIDSAGIGMLFLADKLIKQARGEMTLKNPNGQVKRVFDITSIGKQITIIQE